VSRIRTREQPVQYDQAFAAVLGHEWLAGRAFYTELWDHKPPLLFWSYAAAEWIAGYGESQLLLLSIGIGLLILWLLYYAASRGHQQPIAGLWAAAVWALLSGDLFLEGNLPNGELFLNACSAAILAILLGRTSPLTQKAAAIQYVGIGLLIAAGMAYKPIYAPLAIGFFLAELWSAPTGEKRRTFGRWLMAFGGSVAGTALWILPYVQAPAWGEMLYAVFQFNPQYVQQSVGYTGFWSNLGTSLMFPVIIGDTVIRREALYALILPMAIALAGLFQNRTQSSSWKFWIVLAIGTHLAVSLPGRYYSHYYQLWMPIAALGAGWTLAYLQSASKRRLYPICAAALVLGLLPSYLQAFRRSPDDCSRLLWQDRFVTGKKVGLDLRRLIPEGNRFYHWGHEPMLYFYSQRSPTSGIIGLTPLYYGARAAELNQRLMQTLSLETPGVVIGTRWELVRQPAPEALQWIQTVYHPLPGIPDMGPFRILVRGSTGASPEKQ